MGVSVQTKGGKRAVDTEINLTSFIDLLSCLIAFLLATAVWSQIAALQIDQAPAGDESPVDLPQGLSLKVYLNERGFTVSGKDTLIEIPCTQSPCVQKGASEEEEHKAFYDFSALTAKLTEKKAAWPEEKTVYVELQDEIPYNEMVRTMDTCMATGFTDVSLGGSMM